VRYSLWYNALNMWPACGLEAVELKVPAPENGQNNCPKRLELIRIINKRLLLHLLVVFLIICINDARSNKYQI
jgi:hypothetical protein